MTRALPPRPSSPAQAASTREPTRPVQYAPVHNSICPPACWPATASSCRALPRTCTSPVKCGLLTMVRADSWCTLMMRLSPRFSTLHAYCKREGVGAGGEERRRTGAGRGGGVWAQVQHHVACLLQQHSCRCVSSAAPSGERMQQAGRQAGRTTGRHHPRPPSARPRPAPAARRRRAGPMKRTTHPQPAELAHLQLLLVRDWDDVIPLLPHVLAELDASPAR